MHMIDLLNELASKSFIFLIFLIITFIFGYFFNLGMRLILNSLKPDIRPQNLKSVGMIAFSAYFMFLFLSIFILSMDTIELWFILFIGIIHIASYAEFQSIRKKIILYRHPYKPISMRSRIYHYISVLFIGSTGFASIYFSVTGEKEFFIDFQYSKETLILLKLVLYSMFILLTGSYMVTIAYLYNLKEYRVYGEKIKEIAQAIDSDEESLAGHIVAETKDSIMFKPYNYSSINIPIKDIDLQLPIPVEKKKNKRKHLQKKL